MIVCTERGGESPSFFVLISAWISVSDGSSSKGTGKSSIRKVCRLSSVFSLDLLLEELKHKNMDEIVRMLDEHLQ